MVHMTKMHKESENFMLVILTLFRIEIVPSTNTVANSAFSWRSLEPGGVASHSEWKAPQTIHLYQALRDLLDGVKRILPKSRSACYFQIFKSVIVTPAVYLRLVEFLHVNVQSTGQKSHCVKTISGHHKALFLLNS